jgi:hypothetical protein
LVWFAAAFLVALVVASLAAIVFVLLTASGPPCEVIDATTVTRETREALRAEGWYADSGDSYERLYSEGCLTPAE